jgi:signal transduction histidine kinase
MPVKALRLLLVSDSEDGPRLIASDLEHAGMIANIVRVDDPHVLEVQLATPWDVVLADEEARLSPYKTLGMVRRSSEDVPVVVVCRSPDGRAYVDAVPVGDDPRVSRLARTLERALHETALRAERHELREQLVVAERLASVGFLVAGVAHEINNPLSAIIANHEFIRNELSRLEAAGQDMTDARDSLRDAADAAAVIRQVVRDLRNFSRSEPLESSTPIDPLPVIESALRMTWHEMRGIAKVTRDFGPVPNIVANDARLSQVFLNLLINAAHAIPPGAPKHNEVSIVTRTDADGNFVAVVRDTGRGIAEEHLPYVFDAYFTTKPPGRGTGLGLAVSHRIIALLGGKMTAESAPGKGTTFTIVLPPAPPETPDAARG